METEKFEQMQKEAMEKIDQCRNGKKIRRELDLLMRTGEILVASGADTTRILRTLHRVSAYLGLPDENLHIHVTYNMLQVNLSDEEHSLSKFQRCDRHGINMTAISAVSKLTWRAIREDYSLDQYEEQLEMIKNRPRNYNIHNSLVGDLSAILIENINPLANLVRVPKKQTALLSDFEVKRDRIAHETLTKNVTNLSGVPSWMLSVLSRVMELSGKEHLEEVWPNIEVFFHGGVAFTPYRKQYEQLITKPDMRYMETYNASEGFFGLQDDPADKSMLLMLDYDVFYEFIPMDEFGNENPMVVPLWGVETGRNYAMLISTSCGLWRYVIGDTVKFTSVNPYKFVITGRTKHFINAFGEELIVDNAEKGLAYACQQTGAQVLEYTAAPVFMDAKGKCRHQWLIEFSNEPDDLNLFSQLFDKKLQELNSDYEAKRYKDITLQHLEIVVARHDLFNDWLKMKGKLGGQHKVPRLSNSRDIIDQLLKMNER